MFSSKARQADCRVFFRIYPIESIDDNHVKLDKDEKTIYIRSRQELKRPESSPKEATYWKYVTDGTFRHVSQNHLYNVVRDNVMENVLAGVDAIIMCFGQTGCGKSLTMSGLQELPQDLGIVPRVVNDLFNLKQDYIKNKQKIFIELSYMEYGRHVANDLLKKYPNSLEYPFVGTKLKVKDKDQALNLIFKGEGRKELISNGHSSHMFSSILTFFITIKDATLEKPFCFSSKLHLIDLAGTDSSSNKTCSFKSPSDVGTANLFKSDLEAFVLCLCDNIPEKIKIKIRTNPLIKYLGCSLSNQSILRFVGHISLETENMSITSSLLRFGLALKGLKMRSKIVISGLTPDVETTFYKRELEKMLEEKRQEAIITNQVKRCFVDTERFQQMQRSVYDFLNNGVEMMEVLNVTEIKTTFDIFRKIYTDFDSEKSKIYKEAYNKAIEDTKMSKKSTIAPTTKRSMELRSFSRITPKTSSSESSQKKQQQRVSHIPKRSTHSVDVELTAKSSSIKKDVSYIPDILPEYLSVWMTYTNDGDSNFAVFEEQYRDNELTLHDAYLSYLQELKTLEEFKTKVDQLELELEHVKLLASTSMGKDESLQGVVEACMENLEKARQEELVQTEKCLSCRTKVNVLLNMRHKYRKLLELDFDEYCIVHFQMKVPNLQDFQANQLEMCTVNLEGLKQEHEDRPQECGVYVEKIMTLGKLQELQSLIAKEVQKKIRYEKTHKTMFKL